MKKIITVFVALTFTLSCFFTSCTNLADSFTPAESENASYSISGTITGLGFDGQKSESNSRTAFPDLSDAGTVNYTITAVKTGASPVTATSASGTFTLKIPSAGTWTVKAEGFNTENKKILSTIEYTVDISNSSPSAAVNLEAKPIVTEGGAGTISLSFVNLPIAVQGVKVVCSDASWSNAASRGFLGASTFGINTVPNQTLKSGSYTVEIQFYKDVAGQDLCYSCTQVINVYDGLTTNTWVKHGNEPYLEYKTGGSQTPGSAADFKLTDALLKQFELSSFYVDTAANESGTGVLGSWLNPYKSFDAAYSAVYAKLDSIKDATIFVKGKAEDNYKVPVSNRIVQCKAATSLTIKSWDIEHPAVLTRAESLTSDTFVTNTSTLKLQNLVLDGTNNINGKGCIHTNMSSGSANLELTGVTIRNFFANGNYGYDNGGGIYITNGSVTLNNVTIENCSAQTSGGAIYHSAGTLTITGKTIIKDNHIASVNAETHALENKSLNNLCCYSGTVSISNTGTGSRIGVTKAFANPSANTVQFATDTTTALADKYFSDEGYLIANVSDKANIARSSGTLTGGVYQDVKFEADCEELFKGEDYAIEFTAKLGGSIIELQNWSANISYAGTDITNILGVSCTLNEETKTYKITLPSTFPAGNYYIVVSGTYNGLTYSGTNVVSISDTDYRRLTSNNIEKINMAYFAGREMVFIVDNTVTVSQLQALAEKINSSTATITLNLEEANLTKMNSRAIVQQHVKKVILPKNLSSIDGTYCFVKYNEYLSDIEEFEIAASNSNYIVENGILYNKAKTQIVCYPPAKKDSSFTTPTGVTSIGKYGIAYNRYLKNLDISTVSSIGEYACFRSRDLQSCELKQDGGLGTIGQYAFSECSSLKTITIPASVWRFDGNCFTYCTSLESVTSNAITVLLFICRMAPVKNSMDVLVCNIYIFQKVVLLPILPNIHRAKHSGQERGAITGIILPVLENCGIQDS